MTKQQQIADYMARISELRNEQRRTPKSDSHSRGAITGEIQWVNNQVRILTKGRFAI